MIDCLSPDLSELDFREDGSHKLDSLGWPPALVKACEDPFQYAAGLRNGLVLQFEYAEPVNPEWVTLHCWEAFDHNSGLPFPCPRGVNVRVNDIVWIADAPHGS